MQHSLDTTPLPAPQPAPRASAQSSPVERCSCRGSPWGDLHGEKKHAHTRKEPLRLCKCYASNIKENLSRKQCAQHTKHQKYYEKSSNIRKTAFFFLFFLFFSLLNWGSKDTDI